MINLEEEKQTHEYESILPLINIVFLLLIFFMLAGAFTTPDIFEVNPPESEFEDKIDPKEHLILINNESDVAYQGNQTSLIDLKQIISDELSEKDKSKIIFKIKADANVKANDLILVIDLLQDLGANNIELLTVNN
ncbi:MAG: biopolymer transporter ExbD [Pseudomonadota bacterium]